MVESNVVFDDFCATHELDGSPLSFEEIARLKVLCKPLIEDKMAIEEAYTQEEIEKLYDFSASLATIDDEDGAENREKYMKAIDDDFATSNVSNDGILKKEEYKTYCILSNKFDEEVIGVKTREVTDE